MFLFIKKKTVEDGLELHRDKKLVEKNSSRVKTSQVAVKSVLQLYCVKRALLDVSI
jgi:hypothetical protein